jgi:hypothetical protein
MNDHTSSDEKNIRRRVYDALNVLMALDIISKDKKKGITWRGLPSNLSENTEVNLKYNERRAVKSILKNQ